jgi:AcrR family transcriptional regulator
MSEAQGRRRVTEEDPRYLRVRASLVAALFELAAEVPADEISVSQLASAAGVSRTTFYSHSSSTRSSTGSRRGWMSSPTR